MYAMINHDPYPISATCAVILMGMVNRETSVNQKEEEEVDCLRICSGTMNEWKIVNLFSKVD